LELVETKDGPRSARKSSKHQSANYSSLEK